MAVVGVHTRAIYCQLHGNPHSRLHISKASPVKTVSRPHQILVIDCRTLHVDYHPTTTRRSRADSIYVRSLPTHGTVARKVIGG